ncbi:hypothetical protein ACFL2V_01535 [Pseudomonadota bacterium]
MTIIVLASFSASGAQDGVTVVKLTQTHCQFLETESVEHHFKSASAADCEEINEKTGDKRLAASSPLRLAAGKYIFRVTNRDVPYSLGFWMRGQGVQRAFLPSVSGGGLATGTSKDYAIELKPGKYYFSCPLNPTLDYELLVD